MISATLLGLLFVPLFYLWVKSLFSNDKIKPVQPATTDTTDTEMTP